MTRKMYKPTKNQERKWDEMSQIEMPTDDELKAQWAKSHHGKVRGWGIGKANFIQSNMTQTREYQTGIWQGRVDFVCGLEYQEKQADANMENASAYNLGYYRGHTECESNMKGFDPASKKRLLSYREN